ncbi:hypothetical protein QR680_008016 [Steinernema hermaphroditum]|uniref:Uncharacterized protein n=1 Tax=Steinernema hermaphroditum TaxID=289476 RepID=A0AA39M6W4_9BILA|nr:hypothetical protein QR680_008016 [Steinernema hermaphroditum]
MKIIDDIPTDVVKSQVEESSSSFPIPIKQLMAMIFNKDNMECYMRQMHVDLILNTSADPDAIIEATNSFYTDTL